MTQRLDRLRRALEHAVTAYDRRRIGRTGYNPNALGLYLRGVDDAMERMAKGQGVCEALEAVFNDRLLDACLKAVRGL